MALYLQGVFRRGGTFHLDGSGLDFQGLLGLGGEDHLALDNQSRAHVLLGDLLVIFQGALLKNHLDAFEAAAVVEFDKTKVFHVADGAGPAADGHVLTVKVFHIRKDTGNFCAFHGDSVLSINESLKV